MENKSIKTISYPAIFEKDGKGYSVTVPDIFGGVTCGKDLEDAIFMAKDMIKLMLNEAPAQCFEPKTLQETKTNHPNKLIIMIDIELN